MVCGTLSVSNPLTSPKTESPRPGRRKPSLIDQSRVKMYEFVSGQNIYEEIWVHDHIVMVCFKEY
ncbi:hypothetical protein HanLR1_Chr05g0170271 [Helianthus annuus]|nr:hypothetical protein HanLR1_Chr05g0170271 [Helianthus annuus]